MGYAVYDTPRGNAGYGINDTCHEDSCTTKIDRGLGQLCGDTPGEADEHGCGWWFCDEHLLMGLSGSHVYQCEACWNKYNTEDDDD